MKYDDAYTTKVIQESLYNVQGFTEEFIANGKYVGKVYHPKMPVGRKVGSPGETRTTLTAHTTYTFYDRPGKKPQVLPVGTIVTSRIDPICGRLKR